MQVSATRFSTYVDVMVFLAEADLVPEAQRLANRVEDELAAEGYKALILVRAWGSPGAKKTVRPAG